MRSAYPLYRLLSVDDSNPFTAHSAVDCTGQGRILGIFCYALGNSRLAELLCVIEYCFCNNGLMGFFDIVVFMFSVVADSNEWEVLGAVTLEV